MTAASTPKEAATWLPTLMTKTPEEGYELAVKLARAAIRMTQPGASIRERRHLEYAGDSRALTASGQGVATHFATVTAAGNCWRGTL